MRFLYGCLAAHAQNANGIVVDPSPVDGRGRFISYVVSRCKLSCGRWRRAVWDLTERQTTFPSSSLSVKARSRYRGIRDSSAILATLKIFDWHWLTAMVAGDGGGRSRRPTGVEIRRLDGGGRRFAVHQEHRVWGGRRPQRRPWPRRRRRPGPELDSTSQHCLESNKLDSAQGRSHVFCFGGRAIIWGAYDSK